MMKLIKNNIKLIIGFALGLTFSAVAVYAATVAGINVTYSTTNSAAYGATKTNVQDAIDELYQMANSNEFFLKTYLNKISGATIVGYGAASTENDCSSLSSPPAGKNVYLAYYSDGAIAICIKKNNQQHCFRIEDVNAEIVHLESVFANDTCSGTGGCNDSNLHCGISYGLVRCVDSSDTNGSGLFHGTYECVVFSNINYSCKYETTTNVGF